MLYESIDGGSLPLYASGRHRCWAYEVNKLEKALAVVVSDVSAGATETQGFCNGSGRFVHLIT